MRAVLQCRARTLRPNCRGVCRGSQRLLYALNSGVCGGVANTLQRLQCVWVWVWVCVWGDGGGGGGARSRTPSPATPPSKAGEGGTAAASALRTAVTQFFGVLIKQLKNCYN
jgi:hypothetical protein